MFNNYIYDRLAASDIQDEYDAYCIAPPLPTAPPNLIQYWDRQAAISLSLSQMALDLLSIPAMAAECERVFSSSKILISDRRNRLKDDIIEASECLNYWYRRGYFE
jgi:hAT family C-terminal dimerisation region